jgi:molybdenum cofactor guanylyltransferase
MEKISGIVLAGGLGRRMGGVDKGLQLLHGQPMVAHAIKRLAPQVDEILINANQNIPTYAAFGYRVVSDTVLEQSGGFAGPLAGLQAGLSAASHPLVVTVPCDSPFLPADLVTRLYAAMQTQSAQLAVARTGDQVHPVFALVRRDVFSHLSDFLASGGRKIDRWYMTLRITEVAFDDQPEAFRNINTKEELHAHAGHHDQTQ